MKAKFESKYEKNLKFGVRKVLNPGRDFLENFLREEWSDYMKES
jgi:hypothetical protein